MHNDTVKHDFDREQKVNSFSFIDTEKQYLNDVHYEDSIKVNKQLGNKMVANKCQNETGGLRSKFPIHNDNKQSHISNPSATFDTDKIIYMIKVKESL